MTQEMVSYDLRAIQVEWRDVPKQELNELKVKELARIDILERTYWQAWERSLEPRESTNEVDDGDRIKISKRTTPSNGNPAFLKGVMDCIDRRCKLLGLDAPIKSEVSGANGSSIIAGLSDGTINTIKSQILGIDLEVQPDGVAPLPTELD